MSDNIIVTIVSYDDDHNMHVKFSDGVNETPIYNFQPYIFDSSFSTTDILKKISVAGVNALNDIKNKKSFNNKISHISEFKTLIGKPQTYSISELTANNSYEISI